MESKIPEWFLSFYESLFLTQLRALRQLKSPKPKRIKGTEEKGMSNMEMAVDILRRGQRPLHISEIIAQVKTKYGVTLDRESLVSALVKKAMEAAEKVRRWGDVVELEPMNAFDRRIVHNALKDDPGVETHSVEVEGTKKKAILLRPKR